MAVRPCRSPRCSQLVASESPWCPAHTPPEKPREERSTKGWYGSKRWDALRRQVLRETEMCPGFSLPGDLLTGCGDIVEVVDHIVSPETGLTIRDRARLMFSRPNLRAYCASCHNRRTANEQRRGYQRKH